MRDSEKVCLNCAKYKLIWENYFGKLSRLLYYATSNKDDSRNPGSSFPDLANLENFIRTMIILVMVLSVLPYTDRIHVSCTAIMYLFVFFLFF